MWIFLNDAFLSIVEHNDNPDTLLVRARIEGDIQRAFPNRVFAKDEIVFSGGTDYAYRTTLPRYEVAHAIQNHIMKIDYGNFKSSIPVGDVERHDAYMGVWDEMYKYQEVSNPIHQPHKHWW